MKNIVLFSFVTLLAFMAGCTRETTVEEMMDTESERMQVYNMIMDNPEMRKVMKDMMVQHPEGKMMMGNDGMMGKGHMGMGGSGMHRDSMHAMMQQMMAACAKDSANCNMMSGMMMEHRQVMQQMMQHMHRKGMMDEACYKQMMDNINNMNNMQK